MRIRAAARTDAAAICEIDNDGIAGRRATFEVGVQPRHGRLDDGWKDCVPVERLLGPACG